MENAVFYFARLVVFVGGLPFFLTTFLIGVQTRIKNFKAAHKDHKPKKPCCKLLKLCQHESWGLGTAKAETKAAPIPTLTGKYRELVASRSQDESDLMHKTFTNPEVIRTLESQLEDTRGEFRLLRIRLAELKEAEKEVVRKSMHSLDTAMHRSYWVWAAARLYFIRVYTDAQLQDMQQTLMMHHIQFCAL